MLACEYIVHNICHTVRIVTMQRPSQVTHFAHVLVLSVSDASEPQGYSVSPHLFVLQAPAGDVRALFELTNLPAPLD